MSQERYFYSPDAGINWVGPFTQHELNELRAAGIIQPSFAVRSEAEKAEQATPQPQSGAMHGIPSARFTDVPLSRSEQHPAASVPPGGAFYVVIGTQQIGPLPVEQLEQLVASGQVTDATMVWSASFPQWLPYGQVKQTLTPRQAQESLVGKGKQVAQKMMDTVVKVNSMISTAADLHKLENFSWKKFFGEVFRKHPDEDVYTIFQCGTPTSTPSIEQVVNEWPSPWMFSRFLFCGMALFGIFAWLVIEEGRQGLSPFYCVTGALFFPLALYILFFELNIWRNISMYNAVRCITAGGIVALVMIVLKGDKMDYWYFQAPILEYIKLQAALLIGAHLAKIRMNRILPGMLLGCAVGGGLAVIEYTVSLYVDENVHGISDIIFTLILICICSFLEVVWAVITVGAFCKVQALREREHGQGESKYATMLDVRFLSIAAVPFILHFLRDCLFQYNGKSIWYILAALAAFIIFAILSWWVVMRLIQRGIDQVREAKELAMSATPSAPQEPGPIPPPRGNV